MPLFQDEEVPLGDKCRQLAEIANKNSSKYENLAFYNRDGISLLLVGEEHDFSSSSYFLAVKEGKEYLSDTKANDITGTSLMFYGVPVFDSKGMPIGGIVSVVNGGWLDTIAKGITIGKSSHPSIMNMLKGTMISDVQRSRCGGIPRSLHEYPHGLRIPPCREQLQLDRHVRAPPIRTSTARSQRCGASWHRWYC